MHDRKARSLERWFQILTVLMGGGRPTADDLARRFGVTRRTIFRDIAALEEQRIPVVRQDGCYTIMDTYRVKPIQFQPHEVLALVATNGVLTDQTATPAERETAGERIAALKSMLTEPKAGVA